MTTIDNVVPSRIVATRIFRSSAGNEVIATVYDPVTTPPDEWICEIRISGLAHEVVDRVRGVDSLQALMEALQCIRLHLNGAGEGLTWYGNEAGVFGIPRPIPDYYGVEIERHLEKLVSDEVIRLAKEKRATRKPIKPK